MAWKFGRRGGNVALATGGGAVGAAPMPDLFGWLSLFWPFPAVVASTFLIAWASEVAAFFVSRGLALAILALLQVLPEFAVEAVLASRAAVDPTQLHFVTANFTGANRILVGLALPMIFFITLHVRRKTGTWTGHLALARENSVEVVFLLLPSLYSILYWFKRSISPMDTVVLVGMYAAYLLVLYRLPVAGGEDVDELHGVPARVMKKSRRFQGGFAAGAFLTGGFVLFLTVEPFVHNMQTIAFLLGLNAYLVVQYIAPILSEFPEFLSTSYFARHNKGEDAFSNVVSAKINQWTLLIGMIPVVFILSAYSNGSTVLALPLDPHQNVEVLLTTAQGLFAVACLLKLRFLLWEALALLVLWVFQALDFVWDPFLRGAGIFGPFGTEGVFREWTTLAFGALIVVEAILYSRSWIAFSEFKKVWRTHVRPTQR